MAAYSQRLEQEFGEAAPFWQCFGPMQCSVSVCLVLCFWIGADSILNPPLTLCELRAETRWTKLRHRVTEPVAGREAAMRHTERRSRTRQKEEDGGQTSAQVLFIAKILLTQTLGVTSTLGRHSNELSETL